MNGQSCVNYLVDAWVKFFTETSEKEMTQCDETSLTAVVQQTYFRIVDTVGKQPNETD